MISLMGKEDKMKRRHHTPEQIVRKLREADRLLGEGSSLHLVLLAHKGNHGLRKILDHAKGVRSFGLIPLAIEYKIELK
jgi:hypothetical protein